MVHFPYVDLDGATREMEDVLRIPALRPGGKTVVIGNEPMREQARVNVLKFLNAALKR